MPLGSRPQLVSWSRRYVIWTRGVCGGEEGRRGRGSEAEVVETQPPFRMAYFRNWMTVAPMFFLAPLNEAKVEYLSHPHTKHSRTRQEASFDAGPGLSPG